MTTKGIEQFGGWFAHAEQMRELIATAAEVMLRHGRAFSVADYPESRKFLLEIARVIAKQDPKVSTDPVAVKVREIAPEQMNPAWADFGLVECVCGDVARGLTDVEAFAIYTEIGMDEPGLDLDVARVWKQTLVQAARELCELFALRVFTDIAGDDLLPD